MKKRVYWLMICVAVLVGLLAGCGSPDADSEDAEDAENVTSTVYVLTKTTCHRMSSEYEYTDFETDDLGRVTGVKGSEPATFAYDDAGRMTSMAQSYGGDKADSKTMTYDDAKNTIKVIYEVSGSLNSTPMDSTYQFSDEENGNPTKVAKSNLIHDKDLGDYNESDFLDLHYNDEGLVDKVEYAIHGGKFDHTEELTYDEHGNLTEWVFKDEDGEVYLSYSFEYEAKEVNGKVPELSAFQKYFNMREVALAM